MPQVSADAHVPVPPEVARAIADSLPPSPLRVPPHVSGLRAIWRFRAEGDGALAIHVITYAAGLGWVATLAHEPTQWALRRQAARRVEQLADECRSRGEASAQ
jgi:hypothetical protein